MKYTIDKKESYTIITIEEKKLDTTVAPDLKSEFVKLNAEGINNLILDLTNVKYTDSSGLSSILIANRLCNSTGGLPTTHYTTRANQNGRILLRLSGPGPYLLAAVDMSAAPANLRDRADWQSTWASLTFAGPPALARLPTKH